MKNKYSIVWRQLKNMRANLGVGKIGANQSNDSVKNMTEFYICVYNNNAERTSKDIASIIHIFDDIIYCLRVKTEFYITI